ncbi:MAG TPA: hypothetical protein VF173_05360 [Thermoanaerobaculia bacterium]|nr:hypothetical protein [Thermoanaerobaculia bacterium]
MRQKYISLVVLVMLIVLMFSTVGFSVYCHLQIETLDQKIQDAKLHDGGSTLPKLQERRELEDLRFQISCASGILLFVALLVYCIGFLFRFPEHFRSDQIRKLEIRRSEILSNQTIDIQQVISLNLNHLAEYYEINKSQASNSFWISVIAFFAGLIVLLSSILSYQLGPRHEQSTLTAISTFGGVVAQFISGAYVYLYRKSLSQANLLFKRLASREEIMLAIQESGKIKDPQRQDEVRREVVLALLRAVISNPPEVKGQGQ